MPYTEPEDSNIRFPEPSYLLLDNWKRGVINVVSDANIPKNALSKAINIFLVENGQPAVRPGVDWYGVASPNEEPIDGFDYFDYAGALHLLIAAGGKIYRSTDNAATWTECTGGTYTADKDVDFNQDGSYSYINTGYDNTLRYDGTTTLQTYTALTTPAAPTAATLPASPGTGYTYYYKISAVNQVGFSLASTKVTVAHAVPRSAWDNTVNNATLTMPAYQATQTRYDIYFSEDDINYYYLDSQSSPTLIYKDNGTAQVVPSTLAPTGNTTQGPTVGILRTIGSRQFGVKDPNNRYRIWFTGTGNYSGAFSSAYDGGYLDWQPGGKFFPVMVADYQDAKANPVATIWCDSADGQGCVLHMTLSTLTVGDINITVPSAYKVAGTRGTPAPLSVINVLNDYHFYNSQAVYNYGPRQQFSNFLSTDEVTADIRPSVKRINRAAEDKIASIYHDGTILTSVPTETSTVNNETMMFNTELKAWIPQAFSRGFKKFLKFTEINGTTKRTRLLAVEPGNNRLSYIEDTISGDYGQMFETELVTGMYQTMKNPFEYQFVEEMMTEFTRPQSGIYAELLGEDMKRGFRSIRQIPIRTSSVVDTAAWDTYLWDVVEWDDTTTVPVVASEKTVPRYSSVQTDLRSAQWRVYTNEIESRYVLRRLQTWGTATQAGHPASWRVNKI